LIRKHRLEKKLGLSDVARACDCSVQFISNIEHGRAPLPWNKVDQLASFLGIPAEELQAANLAIRSDFKSFVSVAHAAQITPAGAGRKSKKAMAPSLLRGMTGAVAHTARDAQLRELLERYQNASTASRKKFLKEALRLLPSGVSAE
jgi:transcriptional regulator with XRE-family HTH domain